MPGEIADMMLEGVLCAGCGVWMDGDGEGFPRYCSPECEPDRHISVGEYRHNRKVRTHSCPHCQKLLRGEVAVRQHVAAKHRGA